MKDFKKVFLGLLISSTLVSTANVWIAKAYAQTESITEERVSIKESAGTPNWDYPVERGPWPVKLGLSDDQMTQLVSLKSDYAVNTAKQKSELQADRKKMILLMTAPKIDKQAILSLNKEIDSLKGSLNDARVDQMLSVMNVMTAKQREQMRHHMLVHTLNHHHHHHAMAYKGHKGSEHHSA